MALILGALGDPLDEGGALGGGEGLVGLRRRHDVVGVLGLEPPDEFALARFAGNDRCLSGLGRCERGIAEVESQAALDLLHVGAVTGEAVVRKDRADLAVEVDLGAMAGAWQAGQDHGGGQGGAVGEGLADNAHDTLGASGTMPQPWMESSGDLDESCQIPE